MLSDRSFFSSSVDGLMPLGKIGLLIALSGACYIGGAHFYIHKFPECCKPGFFDIWVGPTVTVVQQPLHLALVCVPGSYGALLGHDRGLQHPSTVFLQGLSLQRNRLSATSQQSISPLNL